MLIENIQNEFLAFCYSLEAIFESDWQLQASIVGFFILIVLIVLIKREWAKHEPHLTNLHQKHKGILHNSSVSNERLAKLDSFTKYDYDRIQQYPDEDPLTFVKKRS